MSCRSFARSRNIRGIFSVLRNIEKTRENVFHNVHDCSLTSLASPGFLWWCESWCTVVCVYGVTASSCSSSLSLAFPHFPSLSLAFTFVFTTCFAAGPAVFLSFCLSGSYCTAALGLGYATQWTNEGGHASHTPRKISHGNQCHDWSEPMCGHLKPKCPA